MIDLLLLLVLIILICFAGVLFFGAPYLPTLAPQVDIAMKLADLQPGQTLLELGCGDGRVLVAAAEADIKAIGYELNPLLALFAWIRTRRYGSKVTIVWGNFWRKEWPATDVVFVFLLDRYMKRLDKRCIQYSTKPLKLVSFAFKVPGRKADKTAKGVYLYIYR